MSKIGIFFGSSSGTTEDIAGRVAGLFGVSSSDVHNVADANAADMANYDVLLLGSSTWGMGDLQDDWVDFLPEALSKTLMARKLLSLAVATPALIAIPTAMHLLQSKKI